MSFEDHPLKHKFIEFVDPEDGQTHVKPISNEWKVMTDFILSQDPHSFRKSWQNINQTLYAELSVSHA